MTKMRLTISRKEAQLNVELYKPNQFFQEYILSNWADIIAFPCIRSDVSKSNGRSSQSTVSHLICYISFSSNLFSITVLLKEETRICTFFSSSNEIGRLRDSGATQGL